MLKIDKLTVGYSASVPVLHDVSISIEAGQFISVVGPKVANTLHWIVTAKFVPVCFPPRQSSSSLTCTGILVLLREVSLFRIEAGVVDVHARGRHRDLLTSIILVNPVRIVRQ